MAVILTVTTTPSSFASGNFPLTILQSGPSYKFTFTPTQAYNHSAYIGFHAFLATNDDGGLWLVGSGGNVRVELYNGAGGGTLVANSSNLTFSAGQAWTLDVNLAVGANASSLVVAGCTTGNGTTSFTSAGTYFTASTLGVGQFTNSGSFVLVGTMSNIDDDAPTGASGSANVGGITGAGRAMTPALASGSSTVGGITSTGSATSPGIASGSSTVGGISSSGVASSVGAAVFGTIGQSTASSRADQTGNTTGTMTTQFSARTPGAAVAINDRLAFNGRRWIVNTAGTLSGGSGPTGSGLQTDGTAQLVAMVSTDTAFTMTTTIANSVLLAMVMRENWSSDPSAPTSNKGGTFALQGVPRFYGGFPSAATALFAMTNAPGGSGHIISATWPQKNVTGAEVSLLVVEVPTTRATSFVKQVSFVEVASATTVQSASVTTTGPAMLVAFWLGTGGVVSVGSQHPGSPALPFQALPNADTSVAIHNNGYIQGKTAWAYQVNPGTYTATWTGTAEGAQLYLVAIQQIEGSVASGAANVGGITSTGSTSAAPAAPTVGGGGPVGGITGAGAAAVAAFGAASVGGITSAGAAVLTTFASGTAQVGGIASSGQAVTAGTASGASTVGGIASTGSASPDALAVGAAAVGGVASSGVAVSVGSGGGVTKDLTDFELQVLEMDRDVMALLGGITFVYTPDGGGPVPVTGMFDENYLFVEGDPAHGGVETLAPAVFVRRGDLPTDPELDDPVLTIRGVNYSVVECKPDSVGGMVFRLAKRSIT